jgi:hypothetical protein
VQALSTSHRHRHEMGRPGLDFDGLLRMDMRMSFGGAAHTDELDDGFPGKRSLPRRDFDSDLDNTSMGPMQSAAHAYRWQNSNDRD